MYYILFKAKYAKLRKKKKQLAEAKNNANKLGGGASGPLSEAGGEKVCKMLLVNI